MNEETRRHAVASAAFDNLLCRPRGSRMRRHLKAQLAGWRDLITKNAYSILSVIVRTQKKSHAQIADDLLKGFRTRK